MQAGRPAITRSTGKGSKITPVENVKICDAAFAPNNSANATQVCLACCIPVSPVPALALPVFTTKARISFPLARCALHKVTGAAQN